MWSVCVAEWSGCGGGKEEGWRRKVEESLSMGGKETRRAVVVRFPERPLQWASANDWLHHVWSRGPLSHLR